METVKDLLDKVYDLPLDDFDAFDEGYKKYRSEKRRLDFLKAYNDAIEAKRKGKLFGTNEMAELTKWLND